MIYYLRSNQEENVSLKIEAIIWDIGGVLWRIEDRSPRYQLSTKYQISLDALNAQVFHSDTARLATLGKITVDDHWKSVAKNLGIPEAEITDFRRGWWAGDRIDREIITFIKELKIFYKTGILSNAWSDSRNALEQEIGDLDIFTSIVYSAEVGLMKPDPAIYVKTLELMQVEPESAIFVDDTEENVAAANELGIRGLLFKSTAQVKADILAMVG